MRQYDLSMKSLFPRLAFVCFIGFGIFSSLVRADEIASQKLMAEIIESPASKFQFPSFQSPETTLRLPVSRGFHQKDSQLCWVYGFLNALESRFMSTHAGEILELSRGTMQRITMQDRFDRAIDQHEVYLSERGDEVDAYQLVLKNGLFAFSDYKDISMGIDTRYAGVKDVVFQHKDVAAQHLALTTELNHLFPELPTQSTFENHTVSPAEMAKAVMGDQKWLSYSPLKSGAEGWRKHPDSDARRGTKSFFMSMQKVVAKIHDSLEHQYPVTYGDEGHVMLIYGADYDSSRKPIRYYMKNSYTPYLFTANPDSLHRALVSISTAY
jgi:hypothetical protein